MCHQIPTTSKHRVSMINVSKLTQKLFIGQLIPASINFQETL